MANFKLKYLNFSLCLIVILFITSALSSTIKTKSFLIVYPPDNAVISNDKTFILGTNYSKNDLLINNDKIKINYLGFFAKVVDLKPGLNTFRINCSSDSYSLIVNHPQNPNNDFAPDSITPNENMAIKAGSTIHFSILAKPASKISLILNNKIFGLYPQGAGVKLSTQYGKSKVSPNKLIKYALDYKVSDSDKFNSTHFKIVIDNNINPIIFNSKTTISILHNDIYAQTNDANTVVRTSPNGSRTTSLDKNVKICIIGYYGDEYCIKYTSQKHVWINKKYLNFLPLNEYNPITAVPRTINIDSLGNYDFIKIPIETNLPYEIDQKLNPNQLDLTLYGAKANIEWITNSNENKLKIIKYVNFVQINDESLKITIHLKSHRQWGYFAQYKDNCLYLFCKQPIVINDDLKGLKICLDPGHGGSENGAIGLSGIKESELNLNITQKVKEILENHGAKVFITRSDNSTYVDLYDRVNFAINNNCDILLSIHNNSLPDGQDPLNESGTSTYWYHIQAVELAKSIKNGIINSTGFNDYGTRFQSLALIRSPNMLSVLAEIGFVINPDDLSNLINPEFQDKIAQGIYIGLSSYLQGNRNDH